MTKYTEQEVRHKLSEYDLAPWLKDMLAAYADLLAAQSGWLTLGVGDGSGNLFVYGPHDAIKECQRRMLAAQPVAVPDAIKFQEWFDDREDAYCSGWNACRKEMLAAPSPAAEGAKVAEGWIRAIDEAMVVHHVGVADAADSYETAKDKLNRLLCCAQDIGALHAQPDEVLSDEQIAYIGEQHGLGTRVENNEHQCDMLWFDSNPTEFARAIERAVLAQPTGGR